MKVIDLLNKIANDEELPKKFIKDIFGQKCEYEYIESRKDWYCHEQYSWFTDNNLLSWLNSELKILDKTIKEDKEIEDISALPPYMFEEEVSKLRLAKKIDELTEAVNSIKQGK